MTQELVTSASGDEPWACGVAGACAAGRLLFVATDDGITRIDAASGRLVAGRRFTETTPYVRAGDTLSIGPASIDVVGRDGALRLQLA